MNKDLFIQNIFENFFKESFEISLLDEILFVNLTKFTKLSVEKSDNNKLKIEQKDYNKNTKKKFDLVIYLFENIDYSLLNSIIKDNCKDMILICSFVSDKIDKNLYRPIDVNPIVGVSNKALKTLKWKPRTFINDLVSKMCRHEINEKDFNS